MRDDPRIIRACRLLRKSSLVEPRPMPSRKAARTARCTSCISVKARHDRALALNGLGAVSHEERVAIGACYVQHLV